jgi:hypothetical protein
MDTAQMLDTCRAVGAIPPRVPALGAALPDEITRWNPVSRTVTPEPVEADTQQYPLWQALYRQTRDIAHAPG